MAVVDQRMQFQRLVTRVWVYTAAVDMGNAATGSGTFASTTVTVPGVALGDIVLAVSADVAVNAGAALVGAVTAADTVTISLLNNTAGAVDLASGTYRVVVLRLSDGVSYV